MDNLTKEVQEMVLSRIKTLRDLSEELKLSEPTLRKIKKGEYVSERVLLYVKLKLE